MDASHWAWCLSGQIRSPHCFVSKEEQWQEYRYFPEKYRGNQHN